MDQQEVGAVSIKKVVESCRREQGSKLWRGVGGGDEGAKEGPGSGRQATGAQIHVQDY